MADTFGGKIALYCPDTLGDYFKQQQRTAQEHPYVTVSDSHFMNLSTCRFQNPEPHILETASRPAYRQFAQFFTGYQDFIKSNNLEMKEAWGTPKDIDQVYVAATLAQSCPEGGAVFGEYEMGTFVDHDTFQITFSSSAQGMEVYIRLHSEGLIDDHQEAGIWCLQIARDGTLGQVLRSDLAGNDIRQALREDYALISSVLRDIYNNGTGKFSNNQNILLKLSADNLLALRESKPQDTFQAVDWRRLKPVS